MTQPIPDDDAVAAYGESYQDNAYYPAVPPERVEAEQHAQAILAASYPIMGDVFDWFQEQIEATDSRRNILAYAQSHGHDVEDCARAFDIVRELFEAKAVEFEQFRKED